MKILIFIDADPVVRHFIHSGQLAPLERSHDVTYVFNDERDVPAEKRRMFTDFESLDLPRILTTKVDRRRHGLWYNLTTTAVLRNHRGTPNYAARRRLAAALTNERVTRRCEFLGQPIIFPIFKWLYLKAMVLHSGVVEILRSEKPDVIVHPSLLNGAFQNEVALAAEKMRVPLVVLMNSWDNPTGKAAAVGSIDQLVVWGEQTREHAITYLKMPPERVHCFGAAQFQVYRHPPKESRERLAEMFGVPSDKKIILYAASRSNAWELDLLKEVDHAIDAGRLPNCHVLYRPHPWRGPLIPGEKDFYSFQFRNISMDPHLEEFYLARIRGGGTSMLLTDYEVTNKLMALVDVIASPLSTLLMESLLNLKPAVMLLPEGDAGRALHMDQIHFQAFAENEGVICCKRSEDLIDACAEALRLCDDEAFCDRLRGQVNRLAVIGRSDLW